MLVLLSRRISSSSHILHSFSSQWALSQKISTAPKRLASSSASTADDSKPLEPVKPGTTPPYSGLLILHTSTPSQLWPSHPNLNSLLIRELTLRLKRIKMGLNISQDPFLSPQSSQMPGTDGGPGEADEEYSATLYRAARPPVRIPQISLRSVHSVLDRLKGLAAETEPVNFETVSERHIFVCTHNSRDCRCGTVGVDVFKRLSELSTSPSTSSASPKVVVREIGHVGQHAFAANVLDFPTGDWYGSVLPENVDTFYRSLTSSTRPLGEEATGSDGSMPRSLKDKKVLANHWRGRMNIPREEQEPYHANLLAQLEAESNRAASTPNLVPITRSKPSTASNEAPPELIKVVFEDKDGVRYEVDAPVGSTLMEAAKKADIETIEGVCGGKLECATCHVYIIPESVPTVNLNLAEPSDAEEDMLEYALFRKDGESRLSCQIKVTEELGKWCEAGGIIRVPAA